MPDFHVHGHIYYSQVIFTYIVDHIESSLVSELEKADEKIEQNYTKKFYSHYALKEVIKEDGNLLR